MKLNVLGMDPSLNNWGLAAAIYDTDTEDLDVKHLSVTQPELPKGKQVRQNSKDLEAAYQLADRAIDAIKDARVVFVEVPVGSQSARAMASYGICVGILGSIRAKSRTFFELNPTEVKLAATGKKTATKQEMIAWAVAKYPNAPWPTYTRNGETLISEAKAEHMADALAAIHAGLQSNQFKQMAMMLKAVA